MDSHKECNSSLKMEWSKEAGIDRGVQTQRRQTARWSSVGRSQEHEGAKTLVVHQHVRGVGGARRRLDLVVQPALGAADVAGHLVVLEPKADLVLGTLHGVAAVDDVPERVGREKR